MLDLYEHTDILSKQIEEWVNDIGYPPIVIYVNKQMYLHLLEEDAKRTAKLPNMMAIQGVFFEGIRVICRPKQDILFSLHDVL